MTKTQQEQEQFNKIQEAVLLKSDLKSIENKEIVRGFEFGADKEVKVDYSSLFQSYKNMGFQASNLGQAIEIVNEMLEWKGEKTKDESQNEKDEYQNEKDDHQHESLENESQESQYEKCKIFLGYTSNLVSSGLREMIRYIVQRNQVNVICSSAGGIEEDFIKCLGSTFMGDFDMDGASLRKQGLNRIGNLIVPNDNYCKFEDWVIPILDKMLEEQKQQGTLWTPSKMIKRLGKEINHPDSIYYWAYKNDISVYCPALTDGSLGDMIYFHSFKNPGLVIDIAADIRSMNDQAVFAPKTGMIILGGGVIKHHICNANLMRNGSDWAVYINTGMEFDGSDAGARCDEAISWGKIKAGSRHVKVHADATLVAPILFAETFAKH